MTDEEKVQEEIYKVVAQGLNVLSAHFEKIAGVSGMIPVSVIKMSHETYLKSFKEGMVKDPADSPHDDLAK